MANLGELNESDLFDPPIVNKDALKGAFRAFPSLKGGQHSVAVKKLPALVQGTSYSGNGSLQLPRGLSDVWMPRLGVAVAFQRCQTFLNVLG